MKLKFKRQTYQAEAVSAVADCFNGQQPNDLLRYRIDPGQATDVENQLDLEHIGFKNAELTLSETEILRNIQSVQQRNNLKVSERLSKDGTCHINLDIDMETGTGKTYVYIKTMFEAQKRYGWSKFIVVVPSIAIREGVLKSFQITAEHFMEEYRKKARFFIYNSKQLHQLESFSSDGGINVMVINVQAFNSRGQDARRIYEELDDFQSRKPIDVIAANRPILILDEPQKMEGAATTESLKRFKPLFVLRYSATHRKEHNKVYRLDALDAYNQKLVKKIAVKGITVKGIGGTSAYLYCENILIGSGKPPQARLEYEVKTGSGIRRQTRNFDKGANLHEHSGNLDQYHGFVIDDIDAVRNIVSFKNGRTIEAGVATGDVSEDNIRRIQIREAVNSHLDREQKLFYLGIKTLSLFFIDEVAKYRCYDDAGAKANGEYADIFEEEYCRAVEERRSLFDSAYQQYLTAIPAIETHNGYFSIDKKSQRLVDPATRRSETEADDVDAYDLILKDKERLLSFEEKTRFIFSHSALREGWDNPNVFVICTLKHSDNTISKRQEVGRGLRLCVNRDGDRMDAENVADVHDLNVLTVIASESYGDFVGSLQKEIVDSLSERPRKANKEFFIGKQIINAAGERVAINDVQAALLERYLMKNDYTDLNDNITSTFTDAKAANKLAPLPDELKSYHDDIFKLIDCVYTDAKLPGIDDERKTRVNPLNANFYKDEFKKLWHQINRKAAYAVDFDSNELIRKSVWALDKELRVAELTYTVQSGEQESQISPEQLHTGSAFQLEKNRSGKLNTSVHSSVPYDLIGAIAGGTKLTRKTITAILRQISPKTFIQFQVNPEDFIQKATLIINEQKASVVIEHLTYDAINDQYDDDIFIQEKSRDDFTRAVKVNKHVFDYVFTDSTNEKDFVRELDSSVEVCVYAKLPRGFFIPTPVGNYNPDWAIAFNDGQVKHIYFIAETKGSMSSMQLRKIEEYKIDCARKFFARITSDRVKYDVVNNYQKLMELVK